LLDRADSEYGTNVPTASNLAKQLAIALHNRIPVFTASQAHLGPIANRWKGQMNENAKTHAFASTVPEQNHNEVLGWKGAGEQSDRWVAVALRDEQSDKHAPRHSLRMDIVRKLVQDRVPYIEVFGEGRSMLARMFSLFALGDYMSVYSALLAGADPNDIGWLYGLKAALKDGSADSITV
jgi:glucose/mannose-6-phosphate isomerase